MKTYKKYLKHKTKKDKLCYLTLFYRDYLISMVNNLSELNNIKLYQNTESLYNTILSELQMIKDNFEQPKKDLIKYSNHICPENIQLILKLFIGTNWINQFVNSDLEIILFISRFFKPISVWDSEYHKNEIPYHNNTSNQDIKKSDSTKDIIDSLMSLIPNPQFAPNRKPIIITPLEVTSFFKSITDVTAQSPKKTNTKRTTHFSETKYSFDDVIKITKNTKSTTLIEDKFGANIFIKINDKVIVIQGIFKNDLLNISNNIEFIKTINIHNYNFINNNLSSIPQYFKKNFLKTLNLRDKIISTESILSDEIKIKFNDFKLIQTKPLLTLINEFLMASTNRKIDILTLLLMSNEDDQKIAFIIFDIFKSQDKKNITMEIYNNLHHSIKELLDISKDIIETNEKELTKITESDIPYERRISLLNTSDDVKAKAMEKLKTMKTNFQGDSKAQAWLDGLLKIPFGIFSQNEIINFKDEFKNKLNKKYNLNLFSENDINIYIDNLKITNQTSSFINKWESYQINKKVYLKEIRQTLDSTVFGHKEAKTQLERIFAQWINGETKGAVLGLQGPPGTGKTQLAKNGLSKCLKDKSGKMRPFAFLPIGGSVNGSTLVGHSFTYVGSTWGRIIDILIVSKCMNPIIFIDELDKVSNTEHGREIISILTHLTDSTQNDEFEDKFFAGIKIDLSKALFVFSFNDPDLIDSILKDRITIIETNPLTILEKITIIKDYMFPEICYEVGFNKEEIILNDDIIKYLIETYTNEAGVRKIKEKIVEIIRDVNLNKFHNNDNIYPFVITKDYIQTLFENKPKVRVKKIPSDSMVGQVNGLYATTSGVGGITLIQTIKFPSTKILDLDITGKAGKVMKESVEYALKNAYTLLTKQEQDDLLLNPYGIHIHFPDGATPKDGPSAGLAITLAFYSLMTDKKIRNDICLTGEIDLNYNAMPIGGLAAKLHGGKKAGCVLALIPIDNLEDLEIMRKENNSPEDDVFKVIVVKNIHEVIKYSIL